MINIDFPSFSGVDQPFTRVFKAVAVTNFDTDTSATLSYAWTVTKLTGYRRAMIDDGEIEDDPTDTSEEITTIGISELIEAE